ncbi:hypothetical protein PsorP6_015661 [Peronosclerospora sorghi]|uniref:Uncharacterized protein n=1 Tax=Peronosclerospora sorghi TaxID=230839 RepID=A0ACC0WMF9_9STRA|nr:hypothetical protein PsorP6_015661 [Peronosclerospora sorghi]
MTWRYNFLCANELRSRTSTVRRIFLPKFRKRSVSSSATDFFLERMDMDEVLECHPVGVCSQMSSVRLRHCEKKLPLMQLSIDPERHERASSASSSIKGDGSYAYMFT